jgi:hypothetical protein
VLDYVLMDVFDPLKQTTAFGLLSAVMGRRLASDSIFEVIMKLAELSIQVIQHDIFKFFYGRIWI